MTAGVEKYFRYRPRRARGRISHNGKEVGRREIKHLLVRIGQLPVGRSNSPATSPVNAACRGTGGIPSSDRWLLPVRDHFISSRHLISRLLAHFAWLSTGLCACKERC